FFAPFFRQTLRRFDIPRLRTLVAAAQQENECVSPLLEVNSVSRAVVDPQLTDTLSGWLHISRMTEGKSVETRCDQTACSLVSQPDSPFPEDLRLLQLDH
ncbi:MAG TPA: hypothetical protein VJU82_10860, partial [Acidobacteriaceae bacterium]|nr:hypothetical protein [Acidobacteriaceae bacterium]